MNLLESQDFDVGVPDLMKARAQEDWSSYFGTLRKMMGGYLDPTYRNALRQIGVESESEIDGIIEDIYSSCLGGIVRDPKKNSTHWCYTSILLQKMSV